MIQLIPRWFGKYTRCSDVTSLRAGDHIAIWDFSRFPFRYQHHGIVWSAGADLDTIQVCHIWSPLTNVLEAQADSSFRISSLRTFIYQRKLKYLRLVEYNTSGLRELLNSWGEVHFSTADIPEVVLARCKFLLGLGRGEFNIFTQNCEHAAHWCKTGQQWCKQNLMRPRSGLLSVPFQDSISEVLVKALADEIDRLKELATREVEQLIGLTDELVYVLVRNAKCPDSGHDKETQPQYLKITSKNQVAVTNIQQERHAFRLECHLSGYNHVRIRLCDPFTQKYMYSRSTLSCFRDVRMKSKNCCRGTSGLEWDLSTVGNMTSMNQHRRYLGVSKKQHTIVDVSERQFAAQFQLVHAPTSSSEVGTRTRCSMVREASMDIIGFEEEDPTPAPCSRKWRGARTNDVEDLV